MRLKKLLHPEIWVPMIILGVLTIPFLVTDLDLTLQKLFYQSGWFLGDKQPWAFLYKGGTFPGLLLSGGALVVLIGAWLWPRFLNWRRSAALIVLTLLLGPGLLVNALGKEYWGRPRPRDVVEFNGSRAFQRVSQPGVPGRGKSFPCGHASVGFLLVSLYFIAQRKKVRMTWLGVGLGYGMMMGIGRMTQGAHFASDILWSGGLTYLSAAMLHHVLLPLSPSLLAAPDPNTPPGKRKALAWTLLGVSLSLLTVFFMLATPYYKTWTGTATPMEGLTSLRLFLPGGKEEIRIIQIQQPAPIKIKAELSGFGFPDLDLKGAILTDRAGTTLNARLDLHFNRLTTERTGRISISVRQNLRLSIFSDQADGDIRINETIQKSRLGEIKILSNKGGILLAAREGSRISGPIQTLSKKGDIRIILEEIADPGASVWEIGNDRGMVFLEAKQKNAPKQKLKIRCWSRFGDVAFTGTISPACGLNLVWNEGDGRSGLSAKGAWKQDGNRVFGPLGMAKPHFEIFLATSSSLIGMELHQGEGAPLVALPTPTAKPTRWADEHEAFSEIMLAPTPTPEPPAWINTELVDISNENYFKPRSPLETTPSPETSP
ncbi:phosphatase PAP2 family protein [bacterium]|nr:phosphatase PAP2 family protein [bacterium]